MARGTGNGGGPRERVAGDSRAGATPQERGARQRGAGAKTPQKFLEMHSLRNSGNFCGVFAAASGGDAVAGNAAASGGNAVAGSTATGERDAVAGRDTAAGGRTTARGRMLRLLRSAPGPLTKQQLAEALGLSMPTVYQSLAQLDADGLVRPCGELSSTGGRRAATFALEPGARLAAGISITASGLRVVVCDLLGSVVAAESDALRAPAEPTDATKRTDSAAERRRRAYVRDIGERARALVRRALASSSLDEGRLLGAGVAVPGVVDPTGREIVSAPTLGLFHVLTNYLVDGLAMPAHVENDACCGGLSEWADSTLRRDLAYLSLEEGVGGAILASGRTLAGANGRAAEFGHLCVEPGGRRCSCGRRGCLEAYCASPRLDEDGWDSYAEHLARGVHEIRMVLDCDVVLGGEAATRLAGRIDDLRARVAALDPFADEATYLSACRHPHDAVPRGAALGVIERFFAEA